MGWFLSSILSMLFLIPAWMAIPFFGKNYGVSTTIFLLWYMAGMVGGTGIILLMQGATAVQLLPGKAVVFGIIGVGIVLGTAANTFLFHAIPIAPNPALPIAIANGACVFVLIASHVAGKRWPGMFDPVSIGLPQVIGILAIVIGAFLITQKP